MKILYLYDIKGWAIENVGRLWLGNLKNVTFKKFDRISQNDIDNHDLVWYGYSRLYNKTLKTDLKKTIISLHDPNELFAPHKKWKKTGMPTNIDLRAWYLFLSRSFVRLQNWRTLRNARWKVVTSNEMKQVLKKQGIGCNIINTTTDITPAEKIPRIDDIRILSVANNHFRKNFKLLKKIIRFCEAKNIKFTLHQTNKFLHRKEYVELLDCYNVYVCTSFQEGGPLPPMDAMARGCAVLTTPVGQIQEMIKNYKNGFICYNYNDFCEKIIYLKNNPKKTSKMRECAIKTIKKRNKKYIRLKVKKFLFKIEQEKKT